MRMRGIIIDTSHFEEMGQFFEQSLDFLWRDLIVGPTVK